MNTKMYLSTLMFCLFFILSGCSITLGPKPVDLMESQKQPIFRLDKISENHSGVWIHGGFRNDLIDALNQPAASSIFTKDGSGLAMQIDITSDHVADEPRLIGLGAFSIVTLGLWPLHYHSEWPVACEVTIRANDGTVLSKYSLHSTGIYDIRAYPLTMFTLLGASFSGDSDANEILRRTARDIVFQIMNAVDADYRKLAAFYRSQPRAIAQKPPVERTGRTVSSAGVYQEPFDEKLPPLRQDASALVIGIDYQGRTDIPNLQYPSQDAKKVYDVLTDPRYGGVPKERAILILNEKATRNEIIAALRKVKNRDGYVYIYFSGHGAPLLKENRLTDAFLVPFDAVISDPETMEETSIKISYLQDLINQSSAKGVLLAIDACYSGSGKSVLPKGGKPLVGMMVNKDLIKPSGIGKVIITSSALNQQSWEDTEELKGGIFSYYLLEGLKGRKGGDAWIKVDALADYIKANVPKAALRLKGTDQNPQVAGKGDFAVVRNWERVRVQDKEIAKSRLKAALEKGLISTDQLNRALDELGAQTRSKILEGFLEGQIDEKKFGDLY